MERWSGGPSMLLIAAFGALLVLMSLRMLVDPRAWSADILRFARWRWFHPFEIGSRWVAGLALLAYAGDTLHPLLFTLMGWLLVGVGIALAALGAHRHREFAERAAGFTRVFRPAGVCGAAFGVFVVCSALRIPEPPPEGIAVHLLGAGPGPAEDAHAEALRRYFERNDDRRHALHRAPPTTQVASPETLLAALRDDPGRAAVGPRFVRLEGDTSFEKKQLRHGLEQIAWPSGTARREALRTVIPVLVLSSPAGRSSCDQLKDDIQYADDNFGGIGFVLDDAGADWLARCAAAAGQAAR